MTKHFWNKDLKNPNSENKYSKERNLYYKRL